jgi:hypothetical protein
MKTTMKTMIDLLVRLQEVEHCAQLALRCSRLTPRERQSAHGHVALVREILPAEVLMLYDQMKESDSDLLDSRELFAMAVFVATCRSLSPLKRKKLLAHFSTEPEPCIRTPGNGDGNGHLARVAKRLHRATRRQLAAQN